MMEVLSLQASNSVEFSDSDGESLNSVVSLHQQLALQQQSWLEDGAEREEDEIVMDDDIEDEAELDKFLGNSSPDATGAFAGGGLEQDGDDVNDEESRDGLGMDMATSFKMKAEGGRGGAGAGAPAASTTARTGATKKGAGGAENHDSGYRLRRSTASFMAYCSQRRETRMMLNGLLGGDSVTSGSLSGSSGKFMDFSAVSLLPSSMATMSSDTETGSNVSGIDVDSPRSQHSTMSNSILNIPSSGKRGPNTTSNPFGGDVGDKARFSQFLASGKRLSSFAREYLHTHQMNSGLGIDPVTGGSEIVHDAVNTDQALARAMKLTKANTSAYNFGASSSDMNLLSPHAERGIALTTGSSSMALLNKKTTKRGGPGDHSGSHATLPNTRSDVALLGSTSFGDLNLMGKSMYVPKTVNKHKSGYLYNPSQGKETVGGRADKVGPSALPNVASIGVAQSKTATSTEIAGDEVSTTAAAPTPSAEASANTIERKESVDTASPVVKTTTISAKVSGKRSEKVEPGDLCGPFSDSIATGVAETAATSIGGVASTSFAQLAGEEFGAVVDDGTSKYFNVADTQVSALSAPYHAPEAVNKITAGRVQVKKTTGVCDHGGRKEPLEGSRGPFLIVESQAPPVDPQKAIHRVRPVQAGTSVANAGRSISPTASASPTNVSRSIAYNDSQPPTARSPTARTPAAVAPFTRTNTSEIPIPDVASVMAPMLSPAPRFDALFAHSQGYSHTGQQKVANITYPLSNTNLQQNNTNAPSGFRTRANSNISYADSDVSYDSHQHIKEMEHVYNQYGDDRGTQPNVMPTVHRKFQADASTSLETIFSDNLTSPPMSAMAPPGRYKMGAIPPSIVLDSHASLADSLHQRRTPGASRGSELDKSTHLDTDSTASRIKRGTNRAISPVREEPFHPKLENSTFPQSMYYNVVKTALDLRQQPNFNPSWDHTRATKRSIRLSSLRKPVDVSLSLTTAPMNITNAKKLADVIKDTDHQRRILSGAIHPSNMTSPTNNRKRPPLTINITSSEPDLTQLGGVLENDLSRSVVDAARGSISGGYGGAGGIAPSGGSLTSGLSSTGAPSAFTRPSVLSRGSFQVPSITELKQGMIAANSLPAPDALLESLVQLRKPLMDDDAEEMSSVGTRTGGGGSSVGSMSVGSAGKTIISMSSGPHLLIKPILGVPSATGSPVTVPGGNSRDSSPVRGQGSPEKGSPPKNGHNGTYVDQKGKLRVKDVKFDKGMLEVLHDIDVEKNAGMTMATLESQHSLTASSVPLVPIKHPYLTMNGTKHVLPDKVLASLVHAQCKASQFDADGSITDTVFLGNTSGMLIRDSTLSHTYEQSGGGIPWLPRGTLEPPEHDRSNQLIGKREKLDLQRHFALDANRQVLTIRSQNAIRGAFEDYVQNNLKPPHRQAAPFNQLDRAQQDVLLQQYTDRAPVLGGKPRL